MPDQPESNADSDLPDQPESVVVPQVRHFAFSVVEVRFEVIANSQKL